MMQTTSDLVIHPALLSGTYPPKENHSPGTATDN